MKSGGAKNGNIASAWELCWESIMKSKLMGGTYIIGTQGRIQDFKRGGAE